jgi:hypothetical protein
MAAEMRKSRRRELVSSKRTRSFSPMVGSFQVRGAGVVKDMPDTGEKMRGEIKGETPVAAPALTG